MKLLLKIIIGIVVLFMLAIGLILFLTGDMVKTGDAFFTSLKNNDINSAYNYLSEDFKSSTDEEQFSMFIKNNSLSEFKESSWEERSINGGRGVLTGSITTESGGVIPIKLSFVKGDQGWKIYSVEKPASGFQEQAEVNSIPSEEDQVKMIMVASEQFAKAVSMKSSADFHATFSSQFKQQFSVEKLDEIYKSFYDLGADLNVLKNYSPIFEEKPSIDENGILRIKGYYPTEPNKFYFNQTYIYEGLGWKLMGYSVNIK